MRHHMPRGLRDRDNSLSNALRCLAVLIIAEHVERQPLPVATFTPWREGARGEEKLAMLTDDAVRRRCHLHLGTRSSFSPCLSLQRPHKGDQIPLFLLGKFHPQD
jgi:hypothetical protein